jgi:hypothetical protein
VRRKKKRIEARMRMRGEVFMICKYMLYKKGKYIPSKMV